MNVSRLVILAAVLLGGGCRTGSSSSTGADAGDHDGGTGGSGGGTSTSSTGGNNGCDGICVDGPAAGWDYPGMLWVGDDEASFPGCPIMAPALGFKGYADIIAPVSCAACTCGPASGTTCEPSPATQPSQPAPTWGTFGRTCRRGQFLPCSDGQTLCFPQPPPGFRVCIAHTGVKNCTLPALAPYTEAHVLFDMVDDTRSCTACTCGAPSGGVCTPSGGDPMGAATPTDGITYCCMPLQ